MRITYYISGHGLGHSVRSIEIMRHLPKDAELIVKTSAPEWFYRQELGRPFEFHSENFDCGVVQGDTQKIDPQATLHALTAILDRNGPRIHEEVSWLRSEKIDLVVSDIPSFPLRAAKEAGLPGVIVSNFIWSEIYKPYTAEIPAFSPLIEVLDAEYRGADMTIVLQPNLPMRGLQNMWTGPMVARKGTSRRQDIARAYNLNPDATWWLFYPGNLGFEVDWNALAELPEAVFLTYRMPPHAPPNVVRLDQGRFPHEDMTASVNGAIAKPGYSMVCECIINQTPFMYTDRAEFIEYEPLHRALQDWGASVHITQNDFAAPKERWREGLAKMEGLRPPPPSRIDGGLIVAQKLTQFARDLQ